MTSPSGSAGNQLTFILELLVEMTIEDSLRQRVRAAKDAAIGRVLAGDVPLVELKHAVQLELGRIDSRYADLTTDELQQVASDYCDRIIAGVDQWEAQDQRKWKAVCSEVIELSSSDYH